MAYECTVRVFHLNDGWDKIEVDDLLMYRKSGFTCVYVPVLSGWLIVSPESFCLNDEFDAMKFADVLIDIRDTQDEMFDDFLNNN